MESIEAKKGCKKLFVAIIGYLIMVLITNLFSYNQESGLLIIGIELVLIVIFVSNILGIINGIRSISFKENSIGMKYLGLLGNIISVLAVAILLFFNTLEVAGYLNG